MADFNAIQEEILELKKEKDALVPTMLNYSVVLKNGSMYNTPPTFAIYLAGLMFDWVEKQGGVKALEAANKEKAGLLYSVIDNSRIFTGRAAPEDRSLMNVTFTLPTQQDTDDFIDLAKKNSLTSLRGHRLTGGLRASIYNGMPYEGVKKLAEIMKEFESKR